MIVTEKKKKNFVIISMVLIVLIIIVMSIVYFIESVPYAKSEDIEISISPENIIVENYNETITINIDLKNIAKSNRKIREYVYTYPTESVGCYFITNISLYSYFTVHNDPAMTSDLPEKVLKPNEIFSFSIDINLGEIKNYTSDQFLHLENPNSCRFYISLKIDRAYKESNEILIDRL